MSSEKQPLIDQKNGEPSIKKVGIKAFIWLSVSLVTVTGTVAGSQAILNMHSDHCQCEVNDAARTGALSGFFIGAAIGVYHLGKYGLSRMGFFKKEVSGADSAHQSYSAGNRP